MKLIYFCLVILLTTNVYSQCFKGNSCYVQPYVQQYVQPQIVEKVIVQQKVVQFDADYFLGVNGYVDVVNQLNANSYSQDKDIVIKQQEQTSKLIQLLEKTIEKLNGNNISVPSNPNVPNVPSNPELPPPPQPNEPKNTSLDQKVFKIFDEKCASCHNDKKQNGNLQLIGSDENGKWLNNLPLEKRVLVYDLVSGEKLAERGLKLMPIGGPPLNDEEVYTLKLWMLEKTKTK